MMFKAIVIACAIMNPKMCTVFEDIRDKLETEKQCISRVYEMRRAIAENLPDLKPMRYKCIKLSKGMFV